jgi:hypothetical protein
VRESSIDFPAHVGIAPRKSSKEGAVPWEFVGFAGFVVPVFPSVAFRLAAAAEQKQQADSTEKRGSRLGHGGPVEDDIAG